MLGEKFEEFVDGLQIASIEEETKRVKEITKRLNKSFRDLDNEEIENSHIVGSLGRDTAIKTFSDVDMLYVLPKELKNQYDEYEGNGQSKLLQKVKQEIKKRYPKTIVRGDGQVVVVSFESINKTVEVCPCFERTDGAYDYLDSNNGGSWKKTDPMPEIDESIKVIDETNSNYKYVCNIVRAWKNNKGFKFGGLLIDTLVYNFFNENENYKDSTFDDYLSLLKDLFYYLKTRNKDQKYWYALGSNQKVYNKGGAFVNQAKKAYEKIKDKTEDSEDLYEKLQDIFGKAFPIPEEIQESNVIEKSALFGRSVRQTEEFIEHKFDVDIRYHLKIDCIVKQDGFRNKFLRNILRDKLPLKANKSLEFFITENEFETLSKDDEDNLYYEVYWKVLNRGEEAIRRDCIRGQIVRDKGTHKKFESTNFKGEHYVECYIVYKNVCVAKDRISVPISTIN
ncbi:nucleotide-binding domain-containing protein [Bacillus licheniformis]|uniref:nucleotide-binding domain-containing protein n=1 Tax=Bacillus licheniformis TaxID=1402 RepID=UPI00214EE86D|nr:nucleotidyltransferase domain-containing protein [Bacillus licheniformis]MCR3918864.1 nucleotidyltransferase domain-containing protein [Bacillus licheniformis]